MVRVRLRTKFLLSMVLVSAGLTSLSLLLVRHTVQAKVVDEIYSDLQNSVTTFQSFQHEQELTLSRFADLLADLTNTRALMTTHDDHGGHDHGDEHGHAPHAAPPVPAA